MSDLSDETHKAKIEALLDMIRRAVAQQDRQKSFREIAEAIALDWYPLLQIDGKKRLSVCAPRTEEEATEWADNGRNTGGKSYR